jgi:glycosyltransferase involved in cell wall biosynthesis
MNLDRPWMSVVIATYNSEKLLEQTIASIRLQKVPSEGLGLEILAVDGGSQDGTLELAQQLGIEVVKNELGHAISAKHIGLLRARSNLVCFLDHDERLVDSQSLFKKHHLFQTDSSLRAAITSGYEITNTQTGANCYASEFGDPFSCYVYRMPNRSDFRIQVLKKRFEVLEETKSYIKFRANTESRPTLLEFVAAGSVVDRDFYLREHSELTFDRNLIPHLYSILSLSDHFAVIADDPVFHESADNWQMVLKKTNWKISNSVFQIGQNQLAGVEGRLRFEKKTSFRRKKVGFALYTLLIVPVLIDSIRMSFKRKDPSYLVHLPLSFYVLYKAASFSLIKKMRLSIVDRRYDGSKSPGQGL